MNMLISVRDRVSGEYSAPYMFVNAEDAKRKLAVAFLSNPFVNDFEVYLLGLFDVNCGVLDCHNGKEFFANMTDILAEVNNA